MTDIRTIISPGMIDTANHFWDSGFQNSEAEMVARCLVIAMKQKGIGFDDWFTYTEVKANITKREHLGHISDYLETDGSKYRVTNEFVRIVAKFIKE